MFLLFVLLPSLFWDFEAATSYCCGCFKENKVVHIESQTWSKLSSTNQHDVHCCRSTLVCTSYIFSCQCCKRRSSNGKGRETALPFRAALWRFWKGEASGTSSTCLSRVCHMSKKFTTRTMCFRWMSAWRVHVSLSKPTCRDELACCACKCITCKSIKTTPRSPTGNQHQSMCICRNGVSNQTQAGPPHHLHLKAAGYLGIRSPCLSRIVWKHVWSKLCRRWAGLWLNTLELPAERLT